MNRKEVELEERVNLMEKEMNLLGDDVEKVKRDLEEAIDYQKLEIESIKAVLKEIVPNFNEKFRTIKNSVLQEVDPQWLQNK
jgi:hypothetical protein